MRDYIYKVYWKKGWIPALLIIAACAYLLHISWLRWGSLLIDTGRELYVPWKVLSGHLLYKDIFYEFGPLTPYLNALLCAIFGVHIRSFIIAGIAVVLAMSFFIYRLSRIFLPPVFSTLSVLTFLFVFAFNQHYEAGIFNYIIPYSYASIYSMLFACAALFFYSRVLLKEKRGGIYLCGFFALLTLATRIEIGIMVIAAVFIGITLDFRGGRSFKKRSMMILGCCLFPVLAAGLIYGLFMIITRSVISSKDALLINLDIKGPLTANTLGTDYFWSNIMVILKVTVYYIGITIVFFTAGWLLFLGRGLRLVKKWFVATGIAFFALGIIILFQINFFPYYLQYRCAPIICLSLFIIALLKYSKVAERKFLFLTVFSTFSFLSMSRMLFAVKAEHSGFYLLVPGMLCYYFFFLNIIPEMFTKSQMRIFYRFAFTVISTVFIIIDAVFSFNMYKQRTMEISSTRGAMRVRPGYYRCQELLEYLRDKTDPSAALVVFPEGLTLNFLSSRDNPLHPYSYLPLWLSNPYNEDRVINGLEDNEVTYVAIIRRDTSDYGAARFGFDYGQGIVKYLSKRYVIEKQFGPWPFTSNEFSLVLLKRR